MGSSSHDLGAEVRMHFFTVNCDTLNYCLINAAIERQINEIS